MRFHVRSASLLLLLAGCGSSPVPTTADSGPIATDAGRDAAIVAETDAGVDAAIVEHDAGPVDPPDTGPSDPDAGPTEDPNLLRAADFATCSPHAFLPTALPDEMNHLTSATLTPTAYPFTVRTLGYFLELTSDDGQCNPGFAHRVELYVTTETAPPNEPGDALARTIDVPAAEPPYETVAGARAVSLTLEEPLTLTEGQHLIIAVQLAAGTPNDEGVLTQSLCASGCFGGAEAGTMFWSNAATVPYAWADLLTDFGIDFEFGAWASASGPEE